MMALCTQLLQLSTAFRTVILSTAWDREKCYLISDFEARVGGDLRADSDDGARAFMTEGECGLEPGRLYFVGEEVVV